MLKRVRLFLLLLTALFLQACGGVTVTPQPNKVLSPESKWDTAYYDNTDYQFN